MSRAVMPARAAAVESPRPAGELKAQLSPLVRELRNRRPQGRCGVFAITGVRRGDGVSYIAELTARELAQQHRTDCLILTVEQLASLPDPLRDDAAVSFAELSPGVWSPSWNHAAGYASEDTVAKRIANLRNWPGGIVLLDCQPIPVQPLTRCVVGRADGVVVVVAAGETTRDEITRTGSLLKRAGAKVLGMVLNKRTYAIPEAVRRML